MTATGTGCLMTRGDTDWIVFTRNRDAE